MPTQGRLGTPTEMGGGNRFIDRLAIEARVMMIGARWLMGPLIGCLCGANASKRTRERPWRLLIEIERRPRGTSDTFGTPRQLGRWYY